MSPSSSTWRAAAPVALAALVALLPACQFVGTKVHNLDELHDASGRHRTRGAIMSDLEYAWRVGLVNGIPGLKVRGVSEDTIENPLELCVLNAAELASFEAESPRVTALQVRCFTRLAVEDPWKLSREEAVLALGRLGAELGISALDGLEDDPASVEEVRDAIARLLNAARSTLDFGELDPTLPEDDLATACARIDALPLDRSGALRLLEAGTLIEARTSLRDERVAPLRTTLVRLEQICVREALYSALRDLPPGGTGGAYSGWESPLVRGAAVRACVQAFGEGALADFLSQLGLDPSPEVAIAILEGVRARGLPAVPERFAGEEAERLRQTWLDRVVEAAAEHPDGTVRIAAMRALSTLAGGALDSLREEDWLEWRKAQ